MLLIFYPVGRKMLAMAMGAMPSFS